MPKPDNFDEWLSFFIRDHEVPLHNVIYEGVVDGQMLHVTYQQLFDKVRPYQGIRKRLREDFCRAAYTGESLDEVAHRIVQEELIDNGHY